jgi:protein KTI12
MCGFPSSGKSTRSREIMDFFKLKTPDCNVHVINDETLGLQKSIYSNSQSEKLARGELLSAVQRNLTKNDIVIVDALNYIKGFRYQLYCTSREVGTSQCTVFCMISQDEALERNRKMGKNAYDEKTFNELIW